MSRPAGAGAPQVRRGSLLVLAGQQWTVMAISAHWVDLKTEDGRTRSVRPAQLADCQVIRC